MKNLQIQKDLYTTLKDFIEKEKVKWDLFKKSQNEFWIEAVNSQLTARFEVDTQSKQIFYDIFSLEDEEHLNFDTIKDVEKRGFIEESRHNWRSEISIEEMWLVLDEIKLWAFKNKYKIIEKILI